MNFLKNVFDSRGSAMVQVMAAAAVVVGVSAYVINTQIHEEKLARTVGNKIQQNVLRREISEALTIPEACQFTLSQNGDLAPNLAINTIMNATGGTMYQVGKEYYGKKIQSMTLAGYVASGDFKLSHLELVVMVDKEVAPGMAQTSKTSFGSGEYTTKFSLPIYLVSTPDNKVRICGSNANGSMEGVYARACENLGGSFNTLKGTCDNLHGTNGAIVNHIREFLCSSSGGGCQHPYALQKCSGVDIRGQNWDNWVVRGFNADASLACSCMAINCPNPASACLGADLGTDHCSNVCPTGTSTTGLCGVPTPPVTPPPVTPPPVTPPPTPCTIWGDWAPDPSTTCSGMTVAQSRSCDNGDSEVRSVSGTKTGSTCCTSWSGWAPSETTECSGSNVAQSRVCTDGTNTVTDTRNILGTKSDSTCCTKWSEWAPETSNTCVGANVTQTRTCIDGTNAGTDSRNSPGSKDGTSCCTSWGAWSPDPSLSCPNIELTQTRSCNDGKSSAVDSRPVNGSKASGCCVAWSDWAPARDKTCTSALMTQTRSCISGGTDTDTQEVSGTKDCPQKPKCMASGTETGSESESLFWNGCECAWVSAGFFNQNFKGKGNSGGIPSSRTNPECCTGRETIFKSDETNKYDELNNPLRCDPKNQGLGNSCEIADIQKEVIHYYQCD